MIKKTRILVAKIAKEMLARGLTDGTAGNVSIQDEESQLIAVTPSGISYHGMTPDQIPVINPAGEIVWGEYAPTSEYRMHLAALKARTDIIAVIHTHSRFSVALACVHQALPAITIDMAAYCGKEAAVIPYMTPGTEELALAVADFIKRGYRGMLLANHGALFVAPDPEMLIEGAESIELAAMAFIRGSGIDRPKPIPDQEIDKLLDLVYGKKRAI